LDLEALCAGPSARRSEQPATGSSSANASSVRTREIYPPKGRESREKDRVQSGENGEVQGVWRVGPCSQQGEMDNGREGRGGVTLYTPCRCPLSLPLTRSYHSPCLSPLASPLTRSHASLSLPLVARSEGPDPVSLGVARAVRVDVVQRLRVIPADEGNTK
jgi:hypothetical protein